VDKLLRIRAVRLKKVLAQIPTLVGEAINASPPPTFSAVGRELALKTHEDFTAIISTKHVLNKAMRAAVDAHFTEIMGEPMQLITNMGIPMLEAVDAWLDDNQTE